MTDRYLACPDEMRPNPRQFGVNTILWTVAVSAVACSVILIDGGISYLLVVSAGLLVLANATRSGDRERDCFPALATLGWLVCCTEFAQALIRMLPASHSWTLWYPEWYAAQLPRVFYTFLAVPVTLSIPLIQPAWRSLRGYGTVGDRLSILAVVIALFDIVVAAILLAVYFGLVGEN